MTNNNQPEQLNTQEEKTWDTVTGESSGATAEMRDSEGNIIEPSNTQEWWEPATRQCVEANVDHDRINATKNIMTHIRTLISKAVSRERERIVGIINNAEVMGYSESDVEHDDYISKQRLISAVIKK